jgi:Transglycosylase SLT domain
MHGLLRVIVMTLALTATALALADTAATTEDDRPTTRVESDSDGNLRKEDAGDAQEPADQPVSDVPLDLLCNTLASSAHKAGLPVSFFSNLIWQESRFVFRAVSPAGALGIAQFMPRTAAAVGLANPFNPLEALPASARLLDDLLQRYGNLGLAAAAYNAGEARVNNWLSKKSGLPQETRNYVLAITGLPVEHWKEAARGLQSFKLPRRMPCRDHEAFADAREASDEREAAESSDPKSASLAAGAPRTSEPSATKGHVRKVTKLRKHRTLGSARAATAARDKRLGKNALKQRTAGAG